MAYYCLILYKVLHDAASGRCREGPGKGGLVLAQTVSSGDLFWIHLMPQEESFGKAG